MLIDGTKFDSTWPNGHPESFAVSSLISGWQYVIARMHVGDRRKVFVSHVGIWRTRTVAAYRSESGVGV
jgi:FKBP-type peptidyl-prolyl cis-trans isomerase